MIKGLDIDKYSHQPWKPSAASQPISNKFKILIYETFDLRNHVIAFIMEVKCNDLTN